MLLTLCNCKSFIYLMSVKYAPGLTYLANTWGKLTYISTNALVKIAAPSKIIIFLSQNISIYVDAKMAKRIGAISITSC